MSLLTEAAAIIIAEEEIYEAAKDLVYMGMSRDDLHDLLDDAIDEAEQEIFDELWEQYQLDKLHRRVQ